MKFENTIKLYGTQSKIDVDGPHSFVDFDKHYQGRGSRNYFLKKGGNTLEEHNMSVSNERDYVMLNNSMMPGSVKNNHRHNVQSSLMSSPLRPKKPNNPSPKFNFQTNSRLMTYQHNHGQHSNMETERFHRTNESFHIEPHQLPTISHMPTKSFNLQT